MEPIFRAVLIYGVLWLLFRVAGRRTVAQLTNFDFILLLIIGEAVQNGLLGQNFSVTAAVLTVVTLLLIDILLSVLKQFVPGVEQVVDGAPFVIVDHGKPLKARMNLSRVDEGDVLESARMKMGLERMDQIKYAVLEKTGEISIIPLEGALSR